MTIKRDADGGSPKDSKLVIKPKSFSQKPLSSPPVKSSADYELLNVIGEGGVGVVYAAAGEHRSNRRAQDAQGASSHNSDQREKFRAKRSLPVISITLTSCRFMTSV